MLRLSSNSAENIAFPSQPQDAVFGSASCEEIMPSGFERQVLLFHVQATSAPKGAPILSLKQIAEIVYEEWKAGRAVTRLEELEAEDLDTEKLDAARKRPNNAVYIQEMAIGPRGCEILLTLGDAGESDPAIVNFKDKGIRYVRKGANGGVGFSAHLAFSFSPSAPPAQYRGVLERMPGLGRNVILNYINRIVRNHTKGQGEYRFVEATTGKDRAYRPRLTTAAAPSRALKSALQTGRLAEVTLIQRTKLEDEIDQNARFKVEEKRLKVSAEDVPPGEAGRLKWLNELKTWAKKRKYEEVQIRLRPQDGGSYLSSRFSTEIADAADAIYSRHEHMDFVSEVAQCHEKAVDVIVENLKTMLKQDSQWK